MKNNLLSNLIELKLTKIKLRQSKLSGETGIIENLHTDKN